MENNIADENVGIELLYRGRDISTVPFAMGVAELHNKYADTLELHQLFTDTQYSKEFNIPRHYKELDVEEYVRGLVPQLSSAEIHGLPVNPETRVEEELALYKARNMYSVLQLMIYIVDTMRKSNIVWGVGRGSAVSSYVLYLIGIHKVDSIKYNLDIKEFLK